MLKNWALSTSSLVIKIFVISMNIVILLEILKAVGWIEPIVKGLAPLLRFLGLNERVGLLWVTGAFFGLALGAAVIVQEAKEGNLKREELEGLHISVGINHAMIEDPALSLALGLNAFWLWVPRTVMAILAVQLFSLWKRLTNGS
jgi:hypothetical protein